MGDVDNGSLLWAAGVRRFGTVLADPPWPSAKGSTTSRHHWLKENMKPRYGTMKARDILDLPIAQVAADDAVLVLWATWMHLDLAMRCVEAWGFRYATGMPWLKITKRSIADQEGVDPIFGPGVWFQHCTELILIGRRGRPFGAAGNPRPARKGIIIAPRQQHSRKPGELQEWVEGANFPTPRIELFATERRPGWTSWGSDLEDGNGRD